METKYSKTIYLAGGCFWGMEKLMQSIPGVIEATRSNVSIMMSRTLPVPVLFKTCPPSEVVTAPARASAG